MIYSIIILSFIGIILSIYAYSVERKSKKQENYKAICDINERMSCSKAFSSKYGSILGISNAIKGIFFYIILIILSFISLKAVFYLSILSLLGTVYLVYVLYFKLKNFCIVCTLIYLVNILLLIFSYNLL